MKIPIIKQLFFIHIIFFLICLDLFAQTPSRSTSYFSIANRLKFGNYLFCQQDYLRAVEEFKAVQKLNFSDTVDFKIAYAYLKMKKYTRALNKFSFLNSNKQFSDLSFLEISNIYFMEKKFKILRNYYRNNFTSDNKYFTNASRLYYFTYFYDHLPLPDSSNFKLWFSAQTIPTIMKFYREKENPPVKSPTLAGILSAIIPGLGKIYVGEIGDGITALLFNSVLGFLAYDNFRADHKFRAWLFSGLTALFYGGNVYGSIAAAQIYNAGLRFRFTQELNLFVKKEKYFTPDINFLCD